MKKLFAALAAGGALQALYACGASGVPAIQPPAQLLATLQVKAQKVCAVGVPLVATMTAMNSNLSAQAQRYLATAAETMNASCVTLASSSSAPLPEADIIALIDDGVPALIKVIGASNWTTDQKSAAQIALTAAQLAVSTALADYVATPSMPPPSAPDPASGAAAS
ncbi:hypothetical protein PQQ51_15120 [Paraburkholderia xenovorans]|uniref:hypothetical protein n=1 Tax=Paraburkholderia xenovorans TaxID=36873 RepID=UPI0038BC3614